MKVKATKTMAKYINSLSNEFECELVKFNERQYAWYVDIEPFNNDIDYDYVNDIFSVLRIVYQDYTAMPKYLRTKDLINIYNSCDGTLDDFGKNILDYIAI